MRDTHKIGFMTTVTLHADEALLAKANEALARRQMTLDEMFEQALRQLTEGKERLVRFDQALQSLKHIHSGGPYTRDELNER